MKVYLADVGPLAHKEKFEALYQTVSPERQKKIDRYKFPEDKLLSLGAAVLLQNALSDNGINRAKIAVSKFGKPYLADCNNLFFNLSHSGTKVMCALADEPIGCDIEIVRDSKLNISSRIFSEDEKRILLCKNTSMQKELMYLLWVAKESYLKMTGEGIHSHLQDISVNIPLGRQLIRGKKVLFTEIPCFENYKAAVCTENNSDRTEIKEIRF